MVDDRPDVAENWYDLARAEASSGLNLRGPVRLLVMGGSQGAAAIDERAPDVAVCCGDFNPSLSQRSEPGQRLLESSGFENAFAGRWRILDTCFARGHSEIAAMVRSPVRITW